MTSFLLIALALPASPTAAWPWPYDWTRFPAAWFGANATQWESPEQIAAIGRYALAILGWQHLAAEDNMTAVIGPQLTQAAILKDAHPTLPVFVYTSFGWAFGMNAAVWPLMADPAYKDFFLQSTGGSFEYSRTNCYQMHTSDKHCVGYFWNFANATARDYFVSHVVAPLALSPSIDGVFFDAFNYAYDIPEVKPWGKPVLNVPNCSTPAAPGAPPGWGGCEALLNGTLDVARRSAALLNARGMVPIYANPGSFARPAKAHIWMDEARLVRALDGLEWYTVRPREDLVRPRWRATFTRDAPARSTTRASAATQPSPTRRTGCATCLKRRGAGCRPSCTRTTTRPMRTPRRTWPPSCSRAPSSGTFSAPPAGGTIPSDGASCSTPPPSAASPWAHQSPSAGVPS